MTTDLAALVREFHEAYACAIRETPTLDVPEAPLRLALIEEEVGELRAAMAAGDLFEVADALGDIAYVVYGAALTFGIDLDAVLREVHRSNMSKLGGDGRPIYRDDGKVLKGPRFSRPDIACALWADRGAIEGQHVMTEVTDAGPVWARLDEDA